VNLRRKVRNLLLEVGAMGMHEEALNSLKDAFRDMVLLPIETRSQTIQSRMTNKHPKKSPQNIMFRSNIVYPQ
jgi:hypothetical protein